MCPFRSVTNITNHGRLRPELRQLIVSTHLLFATTPNTKPKCLSNQSPAAGSADSSSSSSSISPSIKQMLHPRAHAQNGSKGFRGKQTETVCVCSGLCIIRFIICLFVLHASIMYIIWRHIIIIIKNRGGGFGVVCWWKGESSQRNETRAKDKKHQTRARIHFACMNGSVAAVAALMLF